MSIQNIVEVKNFESKNLIDENIQTWSVILCKYNYMVTEEIIVEEISNRPYDNDDEIQFHDIHEIVLFLPNIILPNFNKIILHSYINNIKHETWSIDETVTKFELNKVFIYYKIKNVKYFRNKLNNQVTIE